MIAKLKKCTDGCMFYVPVDGFIYGNCHINPPVHTDPKVGKPKSGFPRVWNDKVGCGHFSKGLTYYANYELVISEEGDTGIIPESEMDKTFETAIADSKQPDDSINSDAKFEPYDENPNAKDVSAKKSEKPSEAKVKTKPKKTLGLSKTGKAKSKAKRKPIKKLANKDFVAPPPPPPPSSTKGKK